PSFVGRIAGGGLSKAVCLRLSFDQATAALKQVRGIVGHLAALLIELAPFVERIAADVGDRGPALLCFLIQVAPRVLARLWCVKQGDGCAQCCSREKPYELAGVVHSFILPIRIRGMLGA